MTSFGIGKRIADTILEKREQNGYFANWDALKTRVRRIAKFKEEHFSFERALVNDPLLLRVIIYLAVIDV